MCFEVELLFCYLCLDDVQLRVDVGGGRRRLALQQVKLCLGDVRHPREREKEVLFVERSRA